LSPRELNINVWLLVLHSFNDFYLPTGDTSLTSIYGGENDPKKEEEEKKRFRWYNSPSEMQVNSYIPDPLPITRMLARGEFGTIYAARESIIDEIEGGISQLYSLENYQGLTRTTSSFLD